MKTVVMLLKKMRK